VSPTVDLVVPVKPLHLAKSRLRGGPAGSEADHRRLVLAMTRDTVAAALGSSLVGRVLAVCSDQEAAAALRADGVLVVPDTPGGGLNAALAHGAAVLRHRAAGTAVGALQADLPALTTAELDAALTAFAAGPGDAVARAFCPDRGGTGTTLLLAGPGVALGPRFGPGSAAAHAASGAVALDGPWPTLRCDVDTGDDLAEAVGLGLGRYSAAVLAGLAVESQS
jgi:2-phospho-L-lactate/phosphoenolpyruvate guanylyltransferase